MTFGRGLLLFCMLGVPLLAQDTSAPGSARTSLETVAARGDPKALAGAMARRPGDWFDVVLSVVAEPMPALDPTKALIAGLPAPEKQGVEAILGPLASAPPASRQAFANAIGALLGATRAFSDSRGDPKALAEAVALATDRIKEANHEWLTARGAITKAIGRFDSGLADLEPELDAAAQKLTTLGDRYDAAFASAFHAKALADKGDLEKALVARERAQAGFKELGAIEKGGPAIRGIIARIDLALAAPLFDDGRDDAAADCCARARAAYKTSDPMRDIEAAAIEAAILVDKGNPAGALAATKDQVARIPQIKDKAVLTRFSTAVATALRLTGKATGGLEVLRKAVARAKELGMTPNEESQLRAAMALVYIQSQQNEPAHAALEVVVKFADEPSLRPLAKAALLNRAILYQTQGRPEEVTKVLERAHAMTLAGPTLDRVAQAGPSLALAEVLVDQGKPKEALRFIKDAATVAEDLGVRLEDVRMASMSVATVGGDPLQVKLGTAFGSYESGADWAGFEPVFLVTERKLQDVLAKGAPDEPGPPDMMERLRESDRQILKLRRAACGARTPISEDEARRIVGFRGVMMEEAWSRAPTFALRRFPRSGSIKRARENYCGSDGVIFGASVTPQAAYAFAFSRDRFCFSAIDVKLRVHDAIATFAGLAKDPKSTPSAWVAASAPLWDNLILKQLAVIEGKQWIVVCPDPGIDTIPIEALVPGDAKSDNWKTLPYLFQKYGVGRLPTSSLAAKPRVGRVTNWLQDVFVGVISPDKAAAGLPFAQAFDGQITAEVLRTERAGLFKLGEPATVAAGPGSEKRDRILVFGHGIADQAIAWEPPTPAVVCVLDPPSAKEGSNVIFRWLIRGVRAVIAPKGPIERPVADALMIGVLKSLGREGGNPIDALTTAKRGLLSGAFKGSVPGLTDAHYHPAHWTQMQVWLVNP